MGGFRPSGGESGTATPDSCALPRLRTVACTKYGVEFSVAASSCQSRNAEIGILETAVTFTFSTPVVFWFGFHDTLAGSPTRSFVPWAVSGTPWTGTPGPAEVELPVGELVVVLVAPLAVPLVSVESATGVDDPPPPHPASARVAMSSAQATGRRFTRSLCMTRGHCLTRRGGAARHRSAAEETLREVPADLVEGDPVLAHRVALAHGDGVVLEGVEVDGHAVRRADLVLAPVATADGAGVVEVDVPAVTAQLGGEIARLG